MILVDSNIPMYLVGAPHPHKADAQRLLERCIAARERLMEEQGIQRILSFDAGFDGLPGIDRVR